MKHLYCSEYTSISQKVVFQPRLKLLLQSKDHVSR